MGNGGVFDFTVHPGPKNYNFYLFHRLSRPAYTNGNCVVFTIKKKFFEKSVYCRTFKLQLNIPQSCYE